MAESERQSLTDVYNYESFTRSESAGKSTEFKNGLRAGDEVSQIGRTRTAPAIGADVSRLAFALLLSAALVQFHPTNSKPHPTRHAPRTTALSSLCQDNFVYCLSDKIRLLRFFLIRARAVCFGSNPPLPHCDRAFQSLPWNKSWDERNKINEIIGKNVRQHPFGDVSGWVRG